MHWRTTHMYTGPLGPDCATGGCSRVHLSVLDTKTLAAPTPVRTVVSVPCSPQQAERRH